MLRISKNSTLFQPVESWSLDILWKLFFGSLGVHLRTINASLSINSFLPTELAFLTLPTSLAKLVDYFLQVLQI